ncbi:MAG TPA: reverse transcriptase domain-containing protein [Roseiflexaceae bacterium]|nr:reverse transcriptase domain-containing protein [Roseiflexaceae bacterium]
MPLFPVYDGPPLLEQVTSLENMLNAWRRVKRNIQLVRQGRSAGIDAVTLSDFEADLARQLDTLVEELRSGRYQPLPPRRVAIPKPKSGGERAIAILAVRDRVVQRALLQVLEPVFDPFFEECSYGCRPRVGVGDALKRVERYAAQGLTWVVDADIAGYFDTLDQRILLGLVRQRVRELPVLQLIARLLEVGACSTAETAPLADERGGSALLRRGERAFRRLLPGDEAPPPPARGMDDYATDVWEHPAAGGWGWGRRDGMFGGLAPSERSPADILWSVYLMGQPLGGLARRLYPHLRALGPQRLLAAGTAALGAAVLAEIVLRWQQRSLRGTAQGGALSPLLANIYLHPFDVALTTQGLRLVRFMDDFVVLCASQEDARRALELVEAQLATLRLTLNREKTRIVRYDDGLEFLGQALAPPRRGPRLLDGVASFAEAHKRLREAARQARRLRRR